MWLVHKAGYNGTARFVLRNLSPVLQPVLQNVGVVTLVLCQFVELKFYKPVCLTSNSNSYALTLIHLVLYERGS